MNNGNGQEVRDLAERLEPKSAEEILNWALETYHPKVALASSFGAEDVALIDMMLKIRPDARVFTLDTGRLNQETYNVMDAIKQKYGIEIDVYFPNREELEEMVRNHGFNLFYKSVEFRKLCCGIRKVEPLGRALSGLDAWITGLRRDQASTRTAIEKVELDESHDGIIKINPIADWTDSMVWRYIRRNNIPYNALHDKGYPSIGCQPCTRAIREGEDPRAGRWWWELASQKECGLHLDNNRGINDIIDRELDLKGIGCPLNFAKSKVVLENMEIGQVLKLVVDDRTAIEELPRAMKLEGQDVLGIKQTNQNEWEIRVKKQG